MDYFFKQVIIVKKYSIQRLLWIDVEQLGLTDVLGAPSLHLHYIAIVYHHGARVKTLESDAGVFLLISKGEGRQMLH